MRGEKRCADKDHIWIKPDGLYTEDGQEVLRYCEFCPARMVIVAPPLIERNNYDDGY